MHTIVDKTQENKSQSVSAASPQMQDSGESTFQFVNNRPEILEIRELQEMADNRPEAIAQRKLQEMANNSPQSEQAAQLQATADNHSNQQRQPPEVSGQTIHKKENNTGIPDTLKTGLENLSGISLDDVKVHRNSDKPAQLQALAYAQGTDIHLASGQEKHLPHEAWHVVQQKRGRVKPTMQMKGNVNVNDDAALEKEADLMGNRVLQQTSSQIEGNDEMGFNTITADVSLDVAQLAKINGHEIDDKKDEELREACGIEKGENNQSYNAALKELKAKEGNLTLQQAVQFMKLKIFENLLERRNREFDGEMGGYVLEDDRDYLNIVDEIKGVAGSLDFVWNEAENPASVGFSEEMGVDLVTPPPAAEDLFDIRCTEMIKLSFRPGGDIGFLEGIILEGRYREWKEEMLSKGSTSDEDNRLAIRLAKFLREEENLEKIARSSSMFKKELGEANWSLPEFLAEDDFGEGAKEIIDKGWKATMQIVESDVINQAGPLRSLKVRQEDHSTYSNKHIRMSTRDITPSRVAHEFGHHLEYNLSPHLWLRLVFLLQNKWGGGNRSLLNYRVPELREPIYDLGTVAIGEKYSHAKDEKKERPEKPEGYSGPYAVSFYPDGGTELIALALEDLAEAFLCAGSLKDEGDLLKGEKAVFKEIGKFDPDIILILLRVFKPGFLKHIMDDLPSIE